MVIPPVRGFFPACDHHVRLRMPGHSQPNGYHRTPPSSTAFSRPTHAQTYTTRQMAPGTLPTHDDVPDAACPDIHNSPVATEHRLHTRWRARFHMPRHTQPDRCHRSPSASTAIPRTPHPPTYTTCLCVLLPTSYAKAASGCHQFKAAAPVRQRKSPSEEGPEL